MMTDLRRIHQEMAAAGMAPHRLIADSRLVGAGDTFVAWPGARVDARQHIPAVIEQGAEAVIYEAQGFTWQPDWQLPHWGVVDLPHQAAAIARAVYGDLTDALGVIAVTGTNGKTSCAQWLARTLDQEKARCAVIGTLGNGYPDALQPASNTTPDVVTLHTLLADFARAGVRRAVMEASSHGLALGRLDGVRVKTALFTNLTRDHLDFHGSMQAYGEAKARLFCHEGLTAAVLNADDPFSTHLANVAKQAGARVLTYGVHGGEVRATHIDVTAQGIRMEVATPWGGTEITSPVIGAFNASNLLGVLATLLADGMPLEMAAVRLALITPVDGRMQRLGGNGRPLVIVDYAHTPDALEKALTTLRAILVPGARLICVFGCGGDRDSGKRPQMGAVTARLADTLIVTSDNPRSEPPAQIAAAIIAGAGTDVPVELDREAAIRQAIAAAGMKDVVLVAGKGHERYQEINGVRWPFSDADVVTHALAAWQRPDGEEEQ